MKPPSWSEQGYRLLRTEMARTGISYAELAQRLQQIGILDNERNLRNKVARGNFSAVFLIQCLMVMGVEQLSLPTLNDWHNAGWRAAFGRDLYPSQGKEEGKSGPGPRSDGEPS